VPDERRLIQIIRDALLQHDPQNLLQLSEYFSTWDGLLKLRDMTTGLYINQNYYDVIFSWFWHQDPAISKIVRTVILFSGARVLTTIIEDFLEQDKDISNFPYEISYNLSEKEFHIDLPGVPGRGVSHYGRDNPEIDRFLCVLEKIYARMYPERIPPGFRQ